MAGYLSLAGRKVALVDRCPGFNVDVSWSETDWRIYVVFGVELFVNHSFITRRRCAAEKGRGREAVFSIQKTYIYSL